MDLAKLTRPLQSTRTLVAAALLCLAATPALAQDRAGTVGDWSYGLDQGVAGASTMNRDQQRFGIVCTENCIGFIESDRPCPENAEFDGAMRSAAGEEATRFVCRHVEGRYVLVLTPTEALIDATAQSTAISLTVPIEPLAPLVFQFSLDGAYDAIYLTLAGAIANASPGTSGPPEAEAPPHDGI